MDVGYVLGPKKKRNCGGRITGYFGAEGEGVLVFTCTKLDFRYFL